MGNLKCSQAVFKPQSCCESRWWWLGGWTCWGVGMELPVEARGHSLLWKPAWDGTNTAPTSSAGCGKADARFRRVGVAEEDRRGLLGASQSKHHRAPGPWPGICSRWKSKAGVQQLLCFQTACRAIAWTPRKLISLTCQGCTWAEKCTHLCTPARW